MGTKVEITIRGPELELGRYEDEATILDLALEVERTRPAPGLITAGCAGCGLCCGDTVPLFRQDITRISGEMGLSVEGFIDRYVDRPAAPDLSHRERTIGEQRERDALTLPESVYLYEHNFGDPFTPKKGADGRCVLLEDNLCTIYPARPFICMLHVCNMGERLSDIHANIVRKGIWDSYRIAGWIGADALEGNPFVTFEPLESIPIAEFELDTAGIMEKLADYL